MLYKPFSKLDCLQAILPHQNQSKYGVNSVTIPLLSQYGIKCIVQHWF